MTNSSTTSPDVRSARRHDIAAHDQRGHFQRDRDRILYSSAFRRLNGITQIVRTGEDDVFHTRQQHTLKVAQVGRRLAEMLHVRQPRLAIEAELDPDVVEAAGMAHDLGHPPFGHICESLLDKFGREANRADGFEGNAQSFRILTKLAVRFDECAGLDLTRAVLNATLKHPWLRDATRKERHTKFGAYASEQADFDFARAGMPDGQRCVEAQVLDWSDDIAYSVHDLEDFVRCNGLPWGRILKSGADLVERARSAWSGAPDDAKERLREAFDNLKTLLDVTYRELTSVPYEGSRIQQRQLRTITSLLIGRYIQATSLIRRDDTIEIAVADIEDAEVKILTQIKDDYIISNPSLVGQQNGQKRIISDLLETLLEATDTSRSPAYPPFLPTRLRYLWDASDGDKVRFVIDCIASMTEDEAIRFHGRITGASGGSLFDPIVR